MAPMIFPLLVIGGGVVALLASRKNAPAASAPPEPIASPPAPGGQFSAPPMSGPSSTGNTMGPMPIMPSGPGSPAGGGPLPVMPSGPSSGGLSTPITLPPITIVGTPAAAAPNSTPWSSDLRVPTNLPAIPADYAANSPETASIQEALNAWIDLVGAPLAQLSEDGSYGPLTQAAAAAFQLWENRVNPGASLAIDGLAGPETQNFLLDYGPLVAGAY